MKKILLAGESWTIHSIHQKGMDTFTTTTYEEGTYWFSKALEETGYKLTHIPNHRVQYDFPESLTEINQYDVVILSDIGSNTFLLPDKTFVDGAKTPNKLELIKEYVINGGSFIMFGGYMAFSGINGASRYGFTPIADILPVECLTVDDRVETPEGSLPEIKDHSIFNDIPKEWPHFLGYNKTISLEDSKTLATINGDPFIATKEVGKGKSLVFTSDMAPHWGSEEFVNWKYYPKLWDNIIKNLTN
ncbi:glutamine amidotransferase [Lentibacillus sp. N15]|uniref:glutamine amidotransferase n=1 Tax=Lentibacillus songyuanensis TaxID=3136161 RepID=UPI0031B9C2B7